MKKCRPDRASEREAGIALLISIFILLLISVVAIALIVSSGTESALAGNYRSSTTVYYASLSGLEEARSRLFARNPSSFNNTQPGFIPSPGVTMAVGSVAYVLNPSPNPAFGETLGNLLALYPDVEYDNEFGPGALAAANAAGTVQTTPSVWSTGPLNAVNGTMGGPFFKWVRINPVSEISLNLDVDADGRPDSPTPIYYNGTSFSNSLSAGPQVFEITSLAVLPDRSRKLLQYLVTPSPVQLPPFLAALTLSGSTNGSGTPPTFHAPGFNAVYAAKGNDQDCNGNPTGSLYAAIGLFGDYTGGSYASDLIGIKGGIPTNVSGTNAQLNYTGLGPAPPSPNPPDVEYLTAFPANLQTPSQLDAIAQTIVQNADVVLPSGPVNYPLPTVTGSALTSLGMSPTNPLTVVVNGNLDISNWSHDGYGLLLVTGTFTYDPDTTWNGIVLVIGQGIVQGSHMQYKQINGAVLVAKTRDTSGVLLTGRIGGASVSFNDNMQGKGIRYSSCWIQKAQPIAGFRVLSFHEIAQ
ncbi:MAG TPA: hypothetical protein VFN26_06800 [Candidatus Acidoferrum sp.]|nr:hypothetical protein [Candidatus Acidoferrum sp.]